MFLNKLGDKLQNTVSYPGEFIVTDYIITFGTYLMTMAVIIQLFLGYRF